MKNLEQSIIKFDYDKNFTSEDFYVSKSNQNVYEFLLKWPKWEKNFINIIGEKYSGKTHLIDIFSKKFKGFKTEAKLINNDTLKQIKVYENIVVENLSENVDEKLLFALMNIIDQENKYLIITSLNPIVDIKFNLIDLNSRSKNFLLYKINKPDDDLIYALIIKNLSDRQISIDKKLVDYVMKRIDRSYSKIFDFIYKIDEISLKKKRSIDLKIIKEVIGV